MELLLLVACYCGDGGGVMKNIADGEGTEQEQREGELIRDSVVVIDVVKVKTKAEKLSFDALIIALTNFPLYTCACDINN